MPVAVGTLHNALRPVVLRPPLVVVTFVPANDIAKLGDNSIQRGFDVIREFTKLILSQRFFPVGYVEIGPTIKYETYDVPLPLIEGETQYSQLSQYISGTSASLRCVVNLFYPTAMFYNVFTTRAASSDGMPLLFNPSFGIIGYNYYYLAKRPEVSMGFIPIAGILNYGSSTDTGRAGNVQVFDKYDYFLIVNARISIPAQSAPIGGTATSVYLEIYSYGGIFVSTAHFKLGSVRGALAGGAPGVSLADIPNGGGVGQVNDFNRLVAQGLYDPSKFSGNFEYGTRHGIFGFSPSAKVRTTGGQWVLDNDFLHTMVICAVYGSVSGGQQVVTLETPYHRVAAF